MGRLFSFFQGWCVYLIAGLLTASTAAAVGLGRIKVYSYLNEPLDAEIELLGASSVVDSLLVSVASVDEFERAQVPRIPLLDQLMFQIVRDEDEIFIHATTKHWVTEPYLDFLLNLAWGSELSPGRLIRRYTILLDPVPKEGKPVYAKRRLLPNTIGQPTTSVNAQKMRYPQSSIADLTQLDLPEEAAERGVPLQNSAIPMTSAPKTPQEKLAELSKAATVTTPAQAANTANSPSTPGTMPERDHMRALFEHHDKPTDLNTVVKEVERIIVSAQSEQPDPFFIEEKTATSAAPADKPASPPPSASEKPAAKQASAPTPSVSPSVPALPTVPTEKRPIPEGVLYMLGALVLVLSVGTIWGVRWWRMRRQFSETRERLAQLSREAVENERASATHNTLEPSPEPTLPPTPTPAVSPTAAPVTQAAPVIQAAPVTQAAPPVQEAPPIAPAVPFSLADVDTLLAGGSAVAESVPAAAPTPGPKTEKTATTAIQIEVGEVTAPLADTEELNVKLQLARQYVELGDFAGAKELLTVINAQGDADQRREAQELLEKII